MNVRTRTTFFLGDLKPATLSLSIRYFSTSFMNVSALLLSPWKVGGSLPIALTFVAAATGWFAVPPAAAGPLPPGGPPPLGGAGDTLREVTFGDAEEWGLCIWCRWCEGVFYVYWTVPNSDV